MDTNTKKLNSEPLVSILMLTYNRANFIGEAISSVLNQTHQNWELIIIDDGSVDNTESIITRYNDSRIKFIKHKNNAGLFQRRNESLKLAVGKYIAVLDSDDYWPSNNKLQLQVSFLEKHLECSVVGCNINIIDADSKIIKEYSYKTTDSTIRKNILLRNQFCHSAVLMRKTAVDKTNGYFDGLAEDLELFLQLGEFGTLANLPETLVSHREHSNSANDHGLKMFTAVHKIIKMHKKYPNYFLALIKSCLQLFLANFI